MQGIQITAIDAISAYSGPHAIPGIRFRPARQAMGVTAWGMNVIEIDPGCEGYPDHDHKGDDQEEVYVILEGSAVLQAHGEEQVVRAGQMIRVEPGVHRKFVTRDEGVRFLAIGGTPGKAYEVREGM